MVTENEKNRKRKRFILTQILLILSRLSDFFHASDSMFYAYPLTLCALQYFYDL